MDIVPDGIVVRGKIPRTPDEVKAQREPGRDKRRIARAGERFEARQNFEIKVMANLQVPEVRADILLNQHDDVEGREIRSIASHERRTLITAAGGSFTPEQWQTLCAEYGNCCARCGDATKLTVDHVIPVSRGGCSDISNIQPLCGSCNSAKGTKKTDYRKKKT